MRTVQHAFIEFVGGGSEGYVSLIGFCFLLSLLFCLFHFVNSLPHCVIPRLFLLVKLVSSLLGKNLVSFTLRWGQVHHKLSRLLPSIFGLDLLNFLAPAFPDLFQFFLVSLLSLFLSNLLFPDSEQIFGALVDRLVIL